MIKSQLDFKQSSVTALLFFAVYLGLDVVLGKALGNSTTFFLLKTCLGFALIALLGQQLMKIKKEYGNEPDAG